MKVVNAYIKPHKLTEVTLALQEIDELPGVSICDVRGFGRQAAGHPKPKINEAIADYAAHVKLEIVCRAELVDRVVEAIVSAASTGLRSDGLLYVTDVDNALRISEGQNGLHAFRNRKADGGGKAR